MYRHTQTAYAMVSVMLLLVALPVGVVLRVPPAPGLIFGRIIALLVFVIVAVCAAIFSRMSVTVEGGELSWNFAFGRLRKSVPLAEITRVEAVRTSVVDGWGIHLTSRGWLYNVSGFDAVWIQLRSGRQFLVGTDRPSQLVDAIEAGRSSFATGRGAPAEEGGSAQRTSHRRAPAFSRAVQSSRRGLRRAETPMTMMSVDELIAKAVEAGLCAARPLRGCSRSEIERLERDSGHSLPASYRRFLELAGHESGLLFRWDHFDVSFEQVTRLTEQEQARLKEDGWPLPDDAFIICGRLDEQFEFIRAGLGDGSPVWYYSESAPAPVVEYPSFAEWLNANLEGAIEAQASGYFEKSWRGPER